MLPGRKDNNSLLLVAFLVFLTRIPFLFNGFGSEEDAWGLMLVAKNIGLSGIYEVSRLPGHPVQEYLLSLIWSQPSWIINLLTAAVSSAGVFVFMATLRELKFEQVIPPGLALAFTPVYFINSTNVMDYTWAVSLVLTALYLTVTGKYGMAGILIGIACGFRITAGAMVLPFAVWHYMNHKSLKAVVVSGTLTLVTAILCYLPVWNTYGPGFFTYYEYFPYPPLLKNIYKGTIGAWGLIGWMALVTGGMLVWLRLRWLRKNRHVISSEGKTAPASDKQPVWNGSVITGSGKALLWMCLLTILLYTYAFLKIPQKTAFVIPMVPFIILLFAVYLSRKQMTGLSIAMVASSFFMGVNLDDPLRGSAASALAIKMNIGNTPVAVDPLSGPVLADHSKRGMKLRYATAVVREMAKTNRKTVVVAGWWQNELNWLAADHQNPLVSYVYYADEHQLSSFIQSGNLIFYLPEQDYWNDIRFGKSFTASLAAPLPVDISH